jgi:uncharacterized protein YecE (DUF72 family)
MLSAFLEQALLLRDKLGPVLFQLPPSLGFDPVSARKFLSLLRENYSGDVVWEARHPAWFEGKAGELLAEFKVARVAADPACVPIAGQPGGFEKLVYFRLHGSPRRYFSFYSETFLNTLTSQLAALSDRAQVWRVFDNTGSGAAIQNALELNAKLDQVLRHSASDTLRHAKNRVMAR